MKQVKGFSKIMIGYKNMEIDFPNIKIAIMFKIYIV